MPIKKDHSLNNQPGTSTGEKLKFCERETDVRLLAKSLKKGKKNNFDHREKHGLELLFDALVTKNQDSHNPITGAAYSSVLIYDISKKLRIHAGANIDPAHAHHLASAKHRNCAEKQASLSAKSDDLGDEHLDLMFLYRKPEANRAHEPEMLVPCSDCAKNYLMHLIENQGKLIILLPDNKDREFLVDANPVNNDHAVSTVKINDKELHYRIIDAEELPYLKIERQLGSKAKNGNDDNSCEIISLENLNKALG